MIETSITISIIVSATALIGYIGRLFFYSKCSHVQLGCLSVDRETSQEERKIENIKL